MRHAEESLALSPIFLRFRLPSPLRILNRRLPSFDPHLTDSLTRLSPSFHPSYHSFYFVLANPGLANCVASIWALCFALCTIVFVRMTFEVIAPSP